MTSKTCARRSEASSRARHAGGARCCSRLRRKSTQAFEFGLVWSSEDSDERAEACPAWVRPRGVGPRLASGRAASGEYRIKRLGASRIPKLNLRKTHKFTSRARALRGGGHGVSPPHGPNSRHQGVCAPRGAAVTPRLPGHTIPRHAPERLLGARPTIPMANY